MARPRLFFLVCPDAELIRQRIEAQLAEHGAGKALRRVFWGDEDLPEAFYRELNIVGLFSEPKVLVLRRAHALKAAQWDALEAACRNVASGVWPFFCLEGEWSGRKPAVPAVLARREIWKAAESAGGVWSSQGLTEQSVRGFVQEWAAARSLSFEAGALEALCRALPLDAVHARLELGKVELAAGAGGSIRAEHAELVCAPREMEFFEFMDALARGGTPAAWQRVFDSQRAGESMLFNLIGYLAWESRVLWMLSHGEAAKVSLPPQGKERKAQLAKKLGAAGIARLIDLAASAEYAVKTGSSQPDQVLDLLVADLCALFKPAAGRPPAVRRHG